MVSIKISSGYDDLCRLCGVKTTAILMGLNIFEEEGIMRQVEKKIHTCLQFQINRSDELPKMICEHCLYKLELLYDFRLRAVRTQSLLKEIYKERNISEVQNQKVIKLINIKMSKPNFMVHQQLLADHSIQNQIDLHLDHPTNIIVNNDMVLEEHDIDIHTQSLEALVLQHEEISNHSLEAQEILSDGSSKSRNAHYKETEISVLHQHNQNVLNEQFRLQDELQPVITESVVLADDSQRVKSDTESNNSEPQALSENINSPNVQCERSSDSRTVNSFFSENVKQEDDSNELSHEKQEAPRDDNVNSDWYYYDSNRNNRDICSKHFLTTETLREHRVVHLENKNKHTPNKSNQEIQSVAVSNNIGNNSLSSLLLPQQQDIVYENLSYDEIVKEEEGPVFSQPSTSSLDNVLTDFDEFVEGSGNVEVHDRHVKSWMKKTACLYCFQEVTNFARHLQRHHKHEGAVKELSTLPLKDPKRKRLINMIRKKGNLYYFNHANILLPVKRSRYAKAKFSDNVSDGKEIYVPCPDCSGFYSRKFLHRHRKSCFTASKNRNKRENHLTDSQIFAICNGAYSDFYNTLKIKDEVFKIMRSDAISKAAMGDVLICSYAESLLWKHKSKQTRTTISNKMRELGRLLLTLKRITGVKKLFDILKPDYFENIVSATKMISGYDQVKRTFRAGSLALSMGSTLKQVCDTATNMVVKKSRLLPCEDQESALNDIEKLKNLIESHWNIDISNSALQNLNKNQWEKPKLLPLTNDLLKFHTYLMKSGQAACQKILTGIDIKNEYRQLSEVVLSLTLLLNRKRREVQYLKVTSYITEIPQSVKEEFFQSVSESETLLTRSFKKVISEGKENRPVAIVFPKSTQRFIDILLSVRDRCVPNSNEYLFANPDTENRWLSGCHILKKLMKLAGVNCKQIFTSIRLHKQIATVSQLINITDTEIEELATFIRHATKIHENFCRLPQNVYQMAKVSKLLLALNKGKCIEYKGKSLDDIQLSDTAESDDSENEDGMNTAEHNQAKANKSELYVLKNFNLTADNEIMKRAKNDVTESKGREFNTYPEEKILNSKSAPRKNKITRLKWTDEQKCVIKKHFKSHIKDRRTPRKYEVEEFLSKYKQLFEGRNWITLKAFVYNCYRSVF